MSVTRRGDVDVAPRDVDARHVGGPHVDGRRARWADHRTARRAELIDATIAAVRRHGATVGMDQIAAAAHTSKPVIYRHFSDKADLYRAVGGRMADELVVDIARATEGVTDPRERTARGIDAFFTVLEKGPELYRFVVAYPMLDDTLGGRGATDVRGEQLVADFIDRVEDLVVRLLVDRPGRDLATARARLWATCIVGLVRSAGDWWLAERTAAARADGGAVDGTDGAAGSGDDGARDPADGVPVRVPTRAELTEQVTTLVWSGVVGALMEPGSAFPGAAGQVAGSVAGHPADRPPAGVDGR